MICPNCFKQISDSNFCTQCGYTLKQYKSNETALPLYTILHSRYMTGRVIGRGGFGIIYIANDLMTNTIVAIKECVPDDYSVRNDIYLTPKADYVKQYQNCISNFVDERSTIKILKNNPGVVKFIDEFSENNTEYFVMEYIDGVSLKYLTTKCGGTLPFGNCIYIFLMVGSILLDIHRQGILHMDISPENIMISADGSVKLIDFGAAKNYLNPKKESVVFLKPGFAPPEQYSLEGNQGPWTDIYALGATFYTIVSGQPLIDSQTRVEKDTMKTLYDLECGISADLSDIIEKSLALEVDSRYNSIMEFFDGIEKYTLIADNKIDKRLLQNISIYNVSHQDSIINNQSSYSDVFYPYVEIISGKSAGKRVRIPDYEFISIGKDPSLVDLVFSETNAISRRHCIVGFDRSKNHFIIIDRSTNGTFFSNGVRMMVYAESYINCGDEFFVFSDDFRLKVYLE